MAFEQRQIWMRAGLAAAGIMLISAGHYFTPPSFLLWHGLFRRVYYLPIIFAALSMGRTAGLAAAGFAAAVYIPHVVIAWGSSPDRYVNQYAEIVAFFLVGGLTGFLADRERTRARELEQTATRLREVYRDLKDSVEHLKRADRLSVVGQLSAGLAHEIRNPLASINGAVEILQGESVGADMRNEFLGIIRKECRRLNQLLTALLDFAGLRQPELREAEIVKLLESVAALTSHVASKSGSRLIIRASKTLPSVVCDPEQIKQVLLNLTINALQAMPAGGEIVLAAQQHDGNLVIQVQDQGDGIPAQDLDRVFDPFFTTKEQGTGLGLSVAHQIVSQHYGTLTVARNEGKGMVFSVALPMQREKLHAS